jgi:molybdopterin/thiamine biosynthesis adenylyltransferase
MSEALHISLDEADHRFSRFELISWWDQARLSSAKALVIGAGALGNEILKNLALLGIGQVLLVDFDKVELSNLSRSVLFRESDCGRTKADAAAGRAQELFPGMRVQPLNANVVYDLGLGVYRWADVILGGLDNREARVAINQSAAKVGKPWIDGAIERLQGVARVFDPANGPCYECTMSDTDWKMLAARRSCALLSRDEMQDGKVPTTPTTSSVIAGIQVQEAVKLLHGMPTMSGQGFVFEGLSHQSYLVNYAQLEDCPSHDAIESVISLPTGVNDTRVGDLLERASTDLGGAAVLEFNHDLLDAIVCTQCNTSAPLLSSLGKVTESQGRCSKCGEPGTPQFYHSVDSSSPLLDRSLAELGVPPWDIVTAWAGTRQQGYELAGDRRTVLGVADREHTAGEGKL